MNSRIISTISLLLAIVVLTPVANANSKSSAKAAAAALKKRAEEAEARKQVDEKRSQMAQGFYNDVHGANPNITQDQIKNMSSEDVRALYCRAYTAKGMPLSEAKTKAEALKIWDN